MSLSIDFRFSGRKSQSQQNLAKKHHSFCETPLTKHYKRYTPATQPKTCLWLVSGKNICTAPFLEPQELHSRSTWKSNICIFLEISVGKTFFLRHRKFLLGCGVNNFLQADRCFKLAKSFELFQFNWNFWKFSYFLAFRSSINSIKTLKSKT